MERNFSVSEASNQAWVLFKKHGLVLSLFVLVIEVLTSGFQQLSMLPFGLSNNSMMFMNPEFSSQQEAFSYLATYLLPVAYISPFAILLSSILFAGFIKMNLDVVCGFSPEASAYKMPLAVYAKVFVLNICFSFITAVGFACCIIPGLFLYIRFMYLPYAVLDNPNCTIKDAFVHSWKMTEGHFWSLLGMCFLIIGICVLGFLCCCIGIIPAYALCLLIIAVSYRMLCPIDSGYAASADDDDDVDAPQDNGPRNGGAATANDTNSANTTTSTEKKESFGSPNEAYMPRPGRGTNPWGGKSEGTYNKN